MKTDLRQVLGGEVNLPHVRQPADVTKDERRDNWLVALVRCAITFGRRVRPLPGGAPRRRLRVMQTLEAPVGRDGFAAAASTTT